MDCEPSGPFITSVLELKLDSRTMFEWQRHSSTSMTIPHYDDLLSFIVSVARSLTCRDDLDSKWRLLLAENELSRVSLLSRISIGN